MPMDQPNLTPEEANQLRLTVQGLCLASCKEDTMQAEVSEQKTSLKRPESKFLDNVEKYGRTAERDETLSTSEKLTTEVETHNVCAAKYDDKEVPDTEAQIDKDRKPFEPPKKMYKLTKLKKNITRKRKLKAVRILNKLHQEVNLQKKLLK